MSITVAVIDDNRLVREALAALLRTLPDMRVVSSATADSSFIERTQPGVVLLDVGLPDEDTVRVAATLAAGTPPIRVIVMDLVPSDEDVMEFVNVGVSGFVLKDATFDEFVDTIRAVAEGRKILPTRMQGSIFSHIARVVADEGAEARADDVRMTPREREVIGLIGEGLSNKEIAQRLNIASFTVKSHVRNVMDKLALHTRLQIAAYSHRESL